jgi:hypothetical protein
MPDAIPSPWTRARRCPICHRAGCLVSSSSDPAAVVCTRTASAVQIGTVGHLHELRPAPAWPAWRRSLERLKKETSR